MAGGSPWSSSSSWDTSSFGSLDDDVVCFVKPDVVSAPAAEGRSIKFLCSYGGRILPRPHDGALRYVGGDNRVLSVDRSIHFYELQRKLTEMCGWEVSVRCQLPTEDLDALVSVKSDDDLANLLEEYDGAARTKDDRHHHPLKIRAFLFPSAPAPSSSVSSRKTSPNAHLHRRNTFPARATPSCSPRRWARPAPQQAAASRHLTRAATIAHQPQHYDDRHGPGELRRHGYLVHNGGHWQ